MFYQNGSLYRAVAGLIGLICLASTIGIVILSVLGKETPSALLAIATGSLGALSSYMAKPPSETISSRDVSDATNR